MYLPMWYIRVHGMFTRSLIYFLTIRMLCSCTSVKFTDAGAITWMSTVFTVVVKYHCKDISTQRESPLCQRWNMNYSKNVIRLASSSGDSVHAHRHCKGLSYTRVLFVCRTTTCGRAVKSSRVCLHLSSFICVVHRY